MRSAGDEFAEDSGDASLTPKQLVPALCNARCAAGAKAVNARKRKCDEAYEIFFWTGGGDPPEGAMGTLNVTVRP